jgi:hypothetical protein
VRIYSLIQLSTFIIAFGVYFHVIESLIQDNIILRYSVFGLIFFSLIYLSKKIEGRFKFLDKRIDKQLSVLIVFGLIFLPLFIGIFN